MKHIPIIFLLVLLLPACNQRSKPITNNAYLEKGKPYTFIEEGEGIRDTATTILSKEENHKSKVTHHSGSVPDSYDNMRGFDPASEDDMNDNGMSRYMENNDEEGWN